MRGIEQRWRRRREGRRHQRPGIDVVVVNYRTPSDLATFMASAAAEVRRADLDIGIVMANVAPLPADLDAAEEIVRSWESADELAHLPFEDNVGYARACNAAAAAGDREVIALFNADTSLTAGVLRQCHTALLSNRRWGALGPRQVDDQGRITAGGTFGTPDQPKQRGWHAQDVGQFSDVRDDAVTVAGSAYFIKRTVWNELTECPIYRRVAPGAVGAFLPTRLFFEETFCSYHLAAHGYRNVYFGEAALIHRWHGSIDSNGAPATELFDESREYFRRACDAHDIVHN